MSNKKALARKFTSTNTETQENQFEGRGFAVQKKSDIHTQKTDLNALLLQAKNFGHSISKLARQESSSTSPQTNGLSIQPKLSIGEPGDRYEQEADRVASQVVQRINTPSSTGESVQREAMPESEEELQMKPLADSIQRVEDDEEELQMKSLADSIQRVEDDEEELQMKTQVQCREAIAGGEASTDLTSAINSERGGGQAIADNIREPMEQAFGADFSGVKVHTDGQSDQLNRSIQARAFTTGQDVFFRQGEYTPGSWGGQELLAHELTHVVQQNGGAVQRSQLIQSKTNRSQRKQISATTIKNITQEVIQKTPEPARVTNPKGAGFHKSNQKRVAVDIDVKVRSGGVFGTGIKEKIPTGTEITIDHDKPVAQEKYVWASYRDKEGYVKKVHLDPVEDNIPKISSKDFKVIKILDSGSTRPQHIRFHQSKQEKVIKFGKDKGHLQTEILSNKLYQAANIPTLKIDIVRVDGQLAQMTDFVTNFKTPDEADLVNSEDFLRHVGADMLFSNWDLFKTDNWMEIDGRMIRADNGGALDRSAQGHMKAKDDWSGEAVKDFASMKDKNNSPYHNVTNHEIADSVRTLAQNLTPEKIDQAFKEAQYPVQLRKTMRKTLLDRIKIGLEWADKVYALDKVMTVDHSWDTGQEMRHEPEDDEPINHALELSQAGFKNVPENLSPEMLEVFLSMGIMEPPDPRGKTGNPHESIPMVGPEELKRQDQFGGGLALQMPKFFARMKAGRLLRRMSDGERQVFEQAAAAKDINTIINLIFPETGKPGARGEMVWSVNKPFIFERELALLKGEEYKGKETSHDPNDYHWIMEIYITDEMLKFLQDYAYINNPTETAKPSAFLGNPTLKLEGQAGGARDKGGIPNVVLKKDGFAKFWRTMQTFQFVEAEDHLWRNASDNQELIKAKIKKDREEQKKIKNQKREELAKATNNDDDYQLNDMFGE